MFIIRIVLIILGIFSICISSSEAIDIEGQLKIPDGSTAENIEITLNGDEFVTVSRIDGSFTFREVPSGIYLLDVSSINSIFPQLKLKISSENSTIHAVEYKYPGSKRLPTTYPLVIIALIPVEYFHHKPPFSIFSLFKNPMMLMMLVSGCAIFFLPNMLSGIDPEQMKELQGDAGGDPMASFKKMMGMASTTNDDEDD